MTTGHRFGRGFGGTLRGGRIGEQAIAYAYDGVMMPARHTWDIEIPAGGLLCMPAANELALTGPLHDGRPLRVEVKTDSHDPVKNPNLFLERWTVKRNGDRVPGGPWRALADGADAYAYYFPVTGLCVWLWELEALCSKLDAAVKTADPKVWRKIRIVNPDGRRALGRVIPRADIRALHADYCEVMLEG